MGGIDFGMRGLSARGEGEKSYKFKFSKEDYDSNVSSFLEKNEDKSFNRIGEGSFVMKTNSGETVYVVRNSHGFSDYTKDTNVYVIVENIQEQTRSKLQGMLK